MSSRTAANMPTIWHLGGHALLRLARDSVSLGVRKWAAWALANICYNGASSMQQGSGGSVIRSSVPFCGMGAVLRPKASGTASTHSVAVHATGGAAQRLERTTSWAPADFLRCSRFFTRSRATLTGSTSARV
jgi:hypothetical protein